MSRTLTAFSLRLTLCVVLFLLLGEVKPVVAASLCDSLNTGRYDIIYVCPDSLADITRRLAVHRSNPLSGGYSAIVAPAESLVTCFGAGRRGIRSLVVQALQNWSAPPAHIVLVGGYGNNTHPLYSDTSMVSVPTWHVDDPPTAFWWGDHGYGVCCEYRTVPTEDPYVFTPGSTDGVPALSIGRLPFDRRTDLNGYIDKVIAYEQQGSQSWKNTALHLIEDHDYDSNVGALTRAHADDVPPENWSNRSQ